MVWVQKEIRLDPRPRGFHLITEEVITGLPELKTVRVGLLNIFIKHTSASLTINENADPKVRKDFMSFFDLLVPQNTRLFEHIDEGPDDMPAHLKASLMASSLDIPITGGRLNLGTWQGIYLGEHRDQGGARKLVLTLNGA